MRIKKKSKTRINFKVLFILFIFLFISSTFLSITKADQSSLYIEPNSLIVEAGDSFYVTVYENNEYGAKIEGATVYIANYGSNDTTDEYGNAFFTAPEDIKKITEIRVYATKQGYMTSSVLIKINPVDSIWDSIIKNKYFLIFVSLIILIFAILIVHFRQKKYVNTRSKELSNEKLVEKWETNENHDDSNKKMNIQHYSNNAVRTRQTNDTKVEEIRITRPSKDKQIVPIKTDGDETEKVINSKKNKCLDTDWFQGTENIRYEIDKITGKVDEKGIDQWYEGIDNLREKIDERLKNREKKKKLKNKV
ncbi:MAG: hypothetical protein BV457_05565 [Thermoplasmata archaeon M9B1D]|nr:MAG: hypothetical protein BV456_10960 [Thermoplasmata archaeon M8B2D]PNX47504.1 MAG: hypothetical protein BV457_05565 [Thermoplasmata archaeon M9B1D]